MLSQVYVQFPDLQKALVRALEFANVEHLVLKGSPAIITSNLRAFADPLSTANVLVLSLAKKAAGIAKGAGDPQKEVVGRVTKEQLEEIAKIKMPDLNCVKVESAMKVVSGTAANMGIKIDGWPEVESA